MDNTSNNQSFNMTDVLLLIHKRWKHLLIICFIAAVVSAVVSLFIPNKYKSSVVLYPANSTSISQTLAVDGTTQKGLLQFGEDEEVEQLMQVLQSNEIRSRIIDKYKLVEHYRIDPNDKYLYTKLYNKYDENVKVSRTEYTSVLIEVFDESPDTAALIANDISYLLDTVYSRMQQERAYKAFMIVENELKEQEATVKGIKDSLQELGRLGIIDVRSQTEMYSEQYAIALASGNARNIRDIEAKLDTLAKYGSAHTILKERLTEEVQTLTLRKNKFREARIELEQDLPNAFIVNKAEKAERKSYPVRWLIVLTSIIATLLLSLIIFAVLESVKKK